MNLQRFETIQDKLNQAYRILGDEKDKMFPSTKRKVLNCIQDLKCTIQAMENLLGVQDSSNDVDKLDQILRDIQDIKSRIELPELIGNSSILQIQSKSEGCSSEFEVSTDSLSKSTITSKDLNIKNNPPINESDSDDSELYPGLPYEVYSGPGYIKKSSVIKIYSKYLTDLTHKCGYYPAAEQCSELLNCWFQHRFPKSGTSCVRYKVSRLQEWMEDIVIGYSMALLNGTQESFSENFKSWCTTLIPESNTYILPKFVSVYSTNLNLNDVNMCAVMLWDIIQNSLFTITKDLPPHIWNPYNNIFDRFVQIPGALDKLQEYRGINTHYDKLVRTKYKIFTRLEVNKIANIYSDSRMVSNQN